MGCHVKRPANIRFMRVIDLREGSASRGYADVLPRPLVDTTKAAQVVGPILARVRHEGAEALYDLDDKFDHVRPASLKVPKDALEQALVDTPDDVLDALRTMIAHTRETHIAQLPTEVVTEVVSGGLVHQRWVPLQRVGLYVPGGLAVYPSSVIMNVVVAQVAGVPSVVVATPPQADFDGLPHPTILAACALLGVEEVIAVGGAQAIAAMAFGFTDGDYVCKPVDKITGPGNIYVAAAKRLVQDTCAIDAEAGTTEIGVLADGSADPRYVAADLISQAEHDPAAASVLVTDSEFLIDAVQSEIPLLISGMMHEERIKQALSGPQSAIVLVRDMDQGEDVVEAYGAEHLEVMTRDAHERAFRINVAGAIFVGPFSPVPLGDYMAGSNHVLPTGGTARYTSGLNAMQFLRSVQVIEYNAAALESIKEDLVAIANAEGLPAHAQAALVREKFEEEAPLRLPLRSELDGVQPYGAPQLDVPVRLNVNENPNPPADSVVQDITDAVRQAARRLNRYADRDAVELREALSDYLRGESNVALPVESIWAANGSNEVMLQLLQAFGGPGRSAMGALPTYSMYHEYARDTNTGWIELPAGNDWAEPQDVQKIIEGLRENRPAVLFLPSPCNPTGIPLPKSDLQAILKASRTSGPGGAATIVVVDEAYAEFREVGTPSALQLLEENLNLVVTRTMSKAFAAAGLRLGYMMAAPEIIYEVQKVRLPYHLSLLTQAAALAALGNQNAQLDGIQEIRDERGRMSTWLSQNGYTVAPSAANFLLFGPVENREEVWSALVDRGILIRVVGPENTLRVTVGTKAENDRFMEALTEVKNG